MKTTDPRAQEVLDFWFAGREHDPRWFTKSDAFDHEVRARFLPLYEEAAAGRLAAWLGSPREALALVVLLDQFPRNMFRGDARAFAADSLAREAARTIRAHGWDRAMAQTEQLFAYLPFEHSEALADQLLACSLMQDFGEEQLRYAVRHREIIERFGRFPHRNAALGRASTPEEIEFLRLPGSGF
jgi:uncharacterized protein (DUF924 family)